MKPTLRLATPGDTNFLFDLRNEASVRQMSKIQQPVPYADHVEWLRRRLANEQAKLWVFTMGEEKIGQFRVDEDGTVSIAIIPAFRGKGLMASLLQIGGAAALAALPGLRSLRAHVRAENETSLKGFLRAGYRFDREFTQDSHKFIELSFSR